MTGVFLSFPSSRSTRRRAQEGGDGDVQLQLARQAFINEKLVDRVADEEEKYALDRAAVPDVSFAAADAAGAFGALEEVMDAAAAPVATATDLV